jgi:hypothetical protein
VLSVALLIFPAAGIGYLLVLTGRAVVRSAAVVTSLSEILCGGW